MDVTDLGTEFTNWNINQTRGLKPQVISKLDMLPPSAMNNPASSLPVKHKSSVINKSKQPVFTVNFTNGGRNVLAGLMNGEFTLWQSATAQFEMVMQAHENAVKCVKFSNQKDWIISGDDDGVLKVWQPNFNNVKMQQIHQEEVRDLCWSPSDQKFASCSDDGSVKIWSFATLSEENVFQGKDAHGWDVKCVDWHPYMSLLVSGSKDNTVRLWDPRMNKPLLTLHEFKNTISKTRFQTAGPANLFAATCTDGTAHVFDIRYLSKNQDKPEALNVLRGHSSSVLSMAWHPIHPNMLSTGTYNGSLHHFILDSASNKDEVGFLYPAWSIDKAHQWPIWDIAYHPAGHMLATGSNDKCVRFWTRAMPGDSERDIKDPVYYNEDGGAGEQYAQLLQTLEPKKTSESTTQKRPIPGL